LIDLPCCERHIKPCYVHDNNVTQVIGGRTRSGIIEQFENR
jgi:hypothetical protein